ncbi:glycosyltransferase [Streptomyces candidus]|uniref:D-inositol 3-phosphate glycosyltransferase n=1 Tax=Streptomyces candidus TaxID=67283 RepID=A0A7X0HG86_9ACTN|nr:glycosyltransferase [Streptomyces candidus]MBB6437080.1 glycosyltransferase involved in cell wall biosynthesis [Streptomyces candidus]GHH32896.1 hypothetical protein GCM10018773_02640 [Streptomyces candidus]
MDVFLVSGSVDARGGEAARARQLAGLFGRMGHRVHLVGIAPAPPGERRPGEPGAEGGPYRRSTLYDVGPPPCAPRRPRGCLDLAARRRRRAHERRMRAGAAGLSALLRGCEGVIVVMGAWALEWVALADTTGFKVVVLSHEPYAVTKRSARYARLRWLCRRHADRVLAPTRQDADWWIRSWLNNVGVMPAPLPGPVPEPSPRDSPCVLSIGRFTHDKGTDILLDAWARIAPSHPGWVLRLYGDGDATHVEALQKRCAELGIAASVRWMGYTADVPGALRGGSVFVLPSRQEGFPLAPLEAMAAGLPCVAFDVSPGVREIVTDEVDGLLARPGHLDEFADRLELLMEDREAREWLGDAARRSVRRYAPEVVARRWEELFALLRR